MFFPPLPVLPARRRSSKRWQFNAFRPRRSPINAVEINGKRVNPAEVHFSLLDNGKVAGVYLFIPGFRAEDVDFKRMGYLLLDEALGEFDVETRIGLIEMFAPETQTEGDRYLLSKLPELFDRLTAKFQKLVIS